MKRFSFTESNNTPLLFISEAKGSKLVDISSDLHPQVLLTYGKKFEHKEPDVLDAEEFIAKKGVTAKGKKCSPLDLKSVEFTEPLHKPEDDIVPADDDLPEDDEPMDVVIDEDIPVVDDAPAADVTPEEPGDAVDFTDWEPTLF